MPICLPNLKSTSVFKVYYGGTGQTSLTQGGVMIGNGTDAVQCITGSEGQVLTWDATLNTWIAKDPTGGSGGTGGNIPDIVITPADNTPTNVIKSIFSDIQKTNSTISLIDWNNSQSGSFRICNTNKSRKYVSVYNDSDQDLYISIANDENPKIQIDFEDKNDLNNIKISYRYMTSSAGIISEKTLFDYKLDDLKNLYSFHTHSQEPSTNKYGYGKKIVIEQCNDKASLTINLTPDFFSQNLNKYLDLPTSKTGSFLIYLSNSSGIVSPIEYFNLTSSNYDGRYESVPYTIYTKISSSTFQSSSFVTASSTDTVNGFDFGYVLDNKVTAPENFTYVIFPYEGITIDQKESSLPLFGYYLKPSSNAKHVTARVTEAI